MTPDQLTHSNLTIRDVEAAAVAAGEALLTGEDDPRLWLAGRARLDALVDVRGGPPLDQAAADVASLAGPPEVLLALGADDRVIPRGGSNSYRMPLADLTPQLRASSCTATPPDGEGLAATRSWRDPLLRAALAGRPVDGAGLRAQAATRLGRLLLLDERVTRRVILSASGTDVEALITHIVQAARNRPVLVVTVGAREAGSGSTLACGLRAFRESAPYAVGLTPGEPLPGTESDRVRVVDVHLRDGSARPRPLVDIEAELDGHCAEGQRRGEAVIAHVMAGSKTGLSSADPAWVRHFTQHRPGVRLIVDAAQLRLPHALVAEFVAAGASVFITGSKAVGGPPFCGAMVPSQTLWADAVAAAERGPLPGGLSRSVSAADLPDELAPMGAGLERVNLGLLARWNLALGEWERWEALGSARRQDLTRALLDGWHDHLGTVEGVRAFPPDERLTPTIVSFLVCQNDIPCGKDRLDEVYAGVLAQPGHYLGQPVALIQGGPAVLRLAVGAPTVTRLEARSAVIGTSAAVAEVVDAAVGSLRQALG